MYADFGGDCETRNAELLFLYTKPRHRKFLRWGCNQELSGGCGNFAPAAQSENSVNWLMPEAICIDRYLTDSENLVSHRDWCNKRTLQRVLHEHASSNCQISRDSVMWKILRIYHTLISWHVIGITYSAIIIIWFQGRLSFSKRNMSQKYISRIEKYMFSLRRIISRGIAQR
jgi:hypothetical protein